MTRPVFVSAVYLPRLPANLIPPPIVIPWIGARLMWATYPDPTFVCWGMAQSFVLMAGSDGHALMEGRAIHAPTIAVDTGDLRGFRIRKGGGS